MREYVIGAVFYVIIAITIISYWAVKIHPEKAAVHNPAVSEIMHSEISENQD